MNRYAATPVYLSNLVPVGPFERLRKLESNTERANIFTSGALQEVFARRQE